MVATNGNPGSSERRQLVEEIARRLRRIGFTARFDSEFVYCDSRRVRLRHFEVDFEEAMVTLACDLLRDVGERIDRDAYPNPWANARVSPIRYPTEPWDRSG